MNVIKNNLYLFKFINKYAKPYYLYIIFAGITSALSVVMEVYGLQLIVDGLTRGEYFQSLLAVVIIVYSLRLISDLYSTMSHYFDNYLMQKLQLGISTEMMKKTTELDFECFDMSEFYDKTARALSGGMGTAGSLVGSLVALASSGTTFVALVGLMAQYHYLYVLIALVHCVITYFFVEYENRKSYDFDYSITNENRAAGYPHGCLYTNEIQKEVRVFGARSFFVELYKKATGDVMKKRNRFNLKISGILCIRDLLYALIMVATVLLSIYRVQNNLLTIGAFVATINGTVSLWQSMYGVVSQVPSFVQNARYVDNLREVSDYQGKIESNLGKKLLFDPTRELTVEFRNVTFIYPSTERKIFDNLSFSFSGKKFVAIVGENGAGKTTFFKLLMRLYDPNEGEILINGIDLRDYDIQSLCAGISACMQDYCYYQYSVRDNITFGKPASDEELHEILKKVRLDDVVDGYEQGLDQKMGKQFWSDGINMSRGQSQKLALARCIFKKSAGLYLLDEPSSALDPIAEEQIGEAMYDISNDKNVLMITQRLTMVRYADYILYLENGQVIESGTHQQLIEQDGKYANMYNTQKKRFI